MNKPSPLIVTLINVTLNPYPGKRPKKLNQSNRKYKIKQLFQKINNLPIEIKASKESLIKRIIFNQVSVCKPGGRGCTGKERHGSVLLNKQAVFKNETGVYYSKKVDHNSNEPKEYGFLEIKGTIEWEDGTINNISVPVDVSGVIGLRMGASKQSVLKPDSANPGKKLEITLADLEKKLLDFLEIKKERSYRIENMNCNFNLYTDLKKERKQNNDPRPRITNYKKVVDMFYADFKTDYKRPLRPYRTVQGAPIVQKSIFKSKVVKSLPTFSISPYGLVEIQGSKRFDTIIDLYNKLMDTFNKIKTDVKFFIPNKESLYVSQPKKKKNISVPKVNNINIKANNDSVILIDGKPCKSYPKPFLKMLAKQRGVAFKGLKQQLCERIRETL